MEDNVEGTYESRYCPYCDFGYGEPDDCLCEEQCGSIGCQGIAYAEINEESAPK